jgi:hypothetical protein
MEIERETKGLFKLVYSPGMEEVARWTSTPLSIESDRERLSDDPLFL